MKKILVPIDFSELSEQALSLAQEIAEKFDAEIIALNIIHVDKSAIFNTDGTLSDANDFDTEVILETEKENLKKIISFTSGYPKTLNMIKIGDIEECILKMDGAHQPDLIVMGTHGSHGLGSLISGSITDKIIRLAEASVISLKCKRDVSEFTKILLAADFKNPIKENIDALKSLVKALKAEIHFLKINTTFNNEKHEDVEERMKRYAEANNLEVKGFHTYLAGTVEAGIEEFSNIEGFEFVAIGSKGRLGLSAFFKGCISADLVNHLHKPIFTFRVK